MDVEEIQNELMKIRSALRSLEYAAPEMWPTFVDDIRTAYDKIETKIEASKEGK